MPAHKHCELSLPTKQFTMFEKWKRHGIYFWQEDLFLDTLRQNWRGPSQPGQMPQQDSFQTSFQTALACGHHSALSSMYAVRNWNLDFDQQEHFSACLSMVQVAREAVSLEFCGVYKDSYTKWKYRPRPQCDCDSEGADACPIMCISPTVLPALRLEHVQSISSAQRLSDGKKLRTMKMQSRREGKGEANKRVGISKKVMSGVNRGRTCNHCFWQAL